MIHCMLLVNRQGKIRLMKWFDCFLINERQRYVKEMSVMVIGRSAKMSNIIEWKQYKIIYKRYASLYFICLSDKEDNELLVLELIHHFVECLDAYFGNVCELDIIFNFQKAYYIIEEILSGGFLQETDRKEIQKLLTIQDSKLKEEVEEDYNPKQ